ncbi:MAG: hypothetical protein RH982_08110 [Parvibaculum sp.]
MSTKRMIFAVCLVATAGFAGPAAAYVGPGAGLSVVSALVGVLLAIGAAVVFIVGWPVRRMMRRRKLAAEMRSPVRDDRRDRTSSSPAR